MMQQRNLRYVDVKEKASSVIKGDQPIHWRLLTTHQVTSTEDALQIVQWYLQRWYVEELFRVLKLKGFKLEDSQLTDVNKLMKLAVITTYMEVNWTPKWFLVEMNASFWRKWDLL